MLDVSMTPGYVSSGLTRGAPGTLNRIELGA